MLNAKETFVGFFIPASLKTALKEKARAEDRSLSKYLQRLIIKSIGSAK